MTFIKNPANAGTAPLCLLSTPAGRLPEGIAMSHFELNEGERLATAREIILDLMFALDTRQKSHKPRTQAEIVEMVHDLLELTDPAPVQEAAALEKTNAEHFLQNPANDDHQGDK